MQSDNPMREWKLTRNVTKRIGSYVGQRPRLMLAIATLAAASATTVVKAIAGIHHSQQRAIVSEMTLQRTKDGGLTQLGTPARYDRDSHRFVCVNLDCQ
jgi:hypothetical protein